MNKKTNKLEGKDYVSPDIKMALEDDDDETVAASNIS